MMYLHNFLFIKGKEREHVVGEIEMEKIGKCRENVEMISKSVRF